MYKYISMYINIYIYIYIYMSFAEEALFVASPIENIAQSKCQLRHRR